VAEAPSNGRPKGPFVDAMALSSGQPQSVEALETVLPFKLNVGSSTESASQLCTVKLLESESVDGVKPTSILCSVSSLASTGKGGKTLVANRSATALLELEQPTGDDSLHF